MANSDFYKTVRSDMFLFFITFKTSLYLPLLSEQIHIIKNQKNE
ncbi:hypothetical protein N474_00700 [Pseudoalteromonas luteoviolacea CPMOR-2]|nr:hypothetical protein N474_00700 [Pseudoalteromonas luteoviolacea CPMOR-2]